MTIRRLVEASAWRVRLSEGDADGNGKFEDWLKANPDNATAWDQIQRSWDRVGELASAPELLRLRSEALDRARRQASARRDYGRLAAAAAAVFLCVAGLVAYLSALHGGHGQQPLIFATTIGERREVTLTDGSHISLDSGTELRVAFTEKVRELELVRGQARFKVAKDPARTFSVKARDCVVVATGTDFNIDLSRRQVAVTLIEGKLTILGGDGRAIADAPAAIGRQAPMSLSAGEQLVIGPAVAPRIAPASLDHVYAWEHGQLMFDDEPLASVAERVSRYMPHPITVDASVAGIRISGVFQTGDADTFVEVVTRYLPVRATRTPDGTTQLHPSE